MRGLEELGRVRLSPNFYLRDFLYSEIANFYAISNIPEFPDLAIATGKQLCEELLEPLQAAFGRIAVRSGYRAVAVTEFPVDGEHVTRFLVEWIEGLRLRPTLDAVILGGITIAGLAVVDAGALALELELPVLVATRRDPSNHRVQHALEAAGLAHRIPLLHAAPAAQVRASLPQNASRSRVPRRCAWSVPRECAIESAPRARRNST